MQQEQMSVTTLKLLVRKNTGCFQCLGSLFFHSKNCQKSWNVKRKNDEEQFIDISTIRQCNKHYKEVHVGKYYSLLKF